MLIKARRVGVDFQNFEQTQLLSIVSRTAPQFILSKISLEHLILVFAIHSIYLLVHHP